MKNCARTAALSEMITQSEGTRLWPARLDSEQTARVLGFQEHDIPVLVGRDMLQPLGKPAANARKYFAAVDVQAVAADSAWLNKATRILYQHWQEKNANRTNEESSAAASAATN